MKFLPTIKGQIKSILFISLLLLPFIAFGQGRKKLESKRKALLSTLKKNKSLLRETKKNKELTYAQFLALKEQVETRRELLITVREEIGVYTNSITRTQEVVESLENDIIRLKEDYGNLLRLAYKQRTTKSNLLFLFSSANFNDAYKRWQYLRQYDQYRKNQASRIVETQKSLERKIALQAERKQEKEKLLVTEEETLVKLKSEMQEKDNILKKLKSKEKQLRSDIKKKQRQHEQLNTEIENIIKGEVNRRRENNRNARITRTPTVDLSGKTNNFRARRGQLPWPLDYGIISSRFGKQAHPTIPDIQIDNSGVDIMTQPAALVKPVFPGTVVAVRYVSGSDYLVIVQHGEYYTLYSQLEDHYVKKDDKVTLDTNLGILANDKRPELHFEVWRNNIRLNPGDWLKRK